MVFVAMSGGVDSSVAAALLKRDGFRVVGVYMKCWTEGPECTSTDDERSARLAAAHLQIPFYVWNFVDEYRQRVVDYMLKGYKEGVTPNPDMMCNREIKFGLFFEKAMNLRADSIATGHYARIGRKGDYFQILKGKDPEKDQSYFLSFIKPNVLSKVLFPIGEYTKKQVREMARRFGLPNAERKGTRGICFVGNVEIEEFLRRYIPPKEGSIVDTNGKTLGVHEGAFYFTIGQRRGIKLPGGPYYVIAKDIPSNTLVVSKEQDDIFKNEVQLERMNWFVAKDIPLHQSVSVKVRYRQEDVLARVERKEGGFWVLQLAKPERAITPGQFAVLYQGDVLIAGGVIGGREKEID